MSKPVVVTFYPKFTIAEAAQIEAEAAREGATVSDLIRQKFRMDKWPVTPQRPVGRPPLPADVRIKRENAREFAKRLRRLAKGGPYVRDMVDAKVAKELLARGREEDLTQERWDWLRPLILSQTVTSLTKEEQAELAAWRALVPSS